MCIYMQGLPSNLISCMMVTQPQQKRAQHSPHLRPQLQENIKMHNLNPWVVLNLLNLHLKTTKDAFAL
jgi:hypothetical protein